MSVNNIALRDIANELRKIREIIEVNEGDYLKRDKVIDTITDVLQGMRCDDDDIYDIVRAIEEMPGERVTSGRESDGVAFKSDCGWSYGQNKD